MRASSSRLAARLLRLGGAGPGAAAGGRAPRAVLTGGAAGFSTSAVATAADGAAAAAGRAGQRRWAAALTACLAAGAGVQLYGASGGGMADCERDATASAASVLAGEGRKKTRIVVLGSGWGSVSFLKNLDPASFAADGPYELVVVSTRGYFLYTPLLPSAAAGSVQERSIVEPVRNILGGQGTFYQATCNKIDAQRRVLHCSFHKCEVCKATDGSCSHGANGTFEVPYDVLVVGVGSVNNTFGIQGVQEHCHFLKSIDDAHRLRVHVSKMVEHAALPNLTPEQRRRHLNFVVVGGGPTGVELAAELHDLVTEDVARLIPGLKDDITITVIDTMDHLLGAFDRQLSDYTRSHFLREGIKVQLGTMVVKVEDGQLTVKRNGNQEQLPYGTCVWATGVAMHPLVRDLREQLPVSLQNSRAGVMVDPYMRVRGTRGTIFAIGDCAVVHQDKAADHAVELFDAADVNKDERVQRDEILAMLKKVSRRYPQMGELAELLQEGVLERAARGVWGGSDAKLQRYARHLDRLEHGLDFSQFRELLADMDTLLRPLAPTAQVASQEGKYLAKLFSAHRIVAEPDPAPSPAAVAAAPAEPARRGWNPFSRAPAEPAAPAAAPGGEGGGRQSVHVEARVPMPEDAPPFKYRHMGAFSYVGADHAVLDLPDTFGPFRTLKGYIVGLSWRSFETWRQVSLRNRLMVQADWIRTKLWGRALSDV